MDYFKVHNKYEQMRRNRSIVDARNERINREEAKKRDDGYFDRKAAHDEKKAYKDLKRKEFKAKCRRLAEYERLQRETSEPA